MAKLSGANDVEKLKNLATKTHKEQAIWYLNAFWEDGTGTDTNAEQIWKYVHQLYKLDPNGAEGNEVDELIMHRFLEAFQETLTVREMRDSLRESGAVIDNRIKNIPISHYLVYRYQKNFHTLVNAVQGSNQKEIDKAQALLDEVQQAFQLADDKAKEAKRALQEAKAAEAEAKVQEAEAKAAAENAKATENAAKANEEAAKQTAAAAKTREEEAVVRQNESIAAKNELELALKDLKEQEDAFTNRKNELTTKSEDESIGAVVRNKAKAELAQHLASDPLPLRRAKITQEAAVKKADKATQVAAEATAKSQAARAEAGKTARAAADSRATAEVARAEAEKQAAEAVQARGRAEAASRASENAAAAAEQAVEAAQAKVEEAETYLEEVKNQPGSAHGAVWWLQRELHEKKAYMPEKKGGYKKN